VELEFRFRNNDMGMLFPTFQERVNAMLPAQKAEAATEASAATELKPPVTDTPHMLNNEEMTQALAQVEEEAAQHSQELMQAHSGLNEQRVARLLGLLD
jgi:hypothetical protein